MAINYSYPRDLVLESSDLLSGIRASNNTTVNFTAKTLSNFLNTNSEVSIGGQLSFRFTVMENIVKTISFAGGGGNNTPFSSIDELIVSTTDLATSNVTVFLDYLVDSDILLSQQNQPNIFGHYKILSYTQIGITNFYTLELEFIGGSGNITDDTYYDISPLNLNQGSGGSQNFQQVIDTGNTLSDGAGTVMDMTATGMFFVNTVNPGYTTNAFVGFDGYQFLAYDDGAGSTMLFNTFQIIFLSGGYAATLTSDTLELQDGVYDTYFSADKTLVRDITTGKILYFSYPASITGTNKTVQWRDRGGNPAFTDEIPSLAGYATETWVGSNFYPLATNPAGYLTSAALSPYLTSADAALTYYPKPTGTVSQYIDGTGALQTFPTIPTIGTWGALNYPTWTTGTPFVKMTAAGTFALDTNTYLTSVGTGTPNELTYWSGANTLGSLSTATYPSLAELSYVKGVTSAIQTQLDAKQNALGYTPYRYVDATQVTYLASVIGLTETIVAQRQIIGSSFNITDIMRMLYKITKPTTTFAVSIRIKINTTNSLVGATQIGVYTMAAANTFALLTRTFNLSGGNLYGYNFASSTVSDILGTNTVGSSTSYDTTNDLYVFFTIQFGNVLDSATFQLANITN